MKDPQARHASAGADSKAKRLRLAKFPGTDIAAEIRETVARLIAQRGDPELTRNVTLAFSRAGARLAKVNGAHEIVHGLENPDPNAVYVPTPSRSSAGADQRTTAKFVLVYSGGGMPATEAGRRKIMLAWDAWFGKLGEAVVDAGSPFGGTGRLGEAVAGAGHTFGVAANPFGGVGHLFGRAANPFGGAAKSIASDGSVREGPVGTRATGYSIIKADSISAAVRLAKGCPGLKAGATITVYETHSA